MFVGHYGVSFAAKRRDPSIPLWALFVAVQLLDVSWSLFVFFGVEKVRIVPGITASNPLDLYYMPYTHSLVAAVLWSVGAYIAYRVIRGFGGSHRAALLVALAVLSPWVLDFIVHRPDLPLVADAPKGALGPAPLGGLLAVPPVAALVGLGVGIGRAVLPNLSLRRGSLRLRTEPVPDNWRDIVARNGPLAAGLSPGERERLLRLAQVFVHDKPFEGCGGLEITEEIRVTIAAHACLLLLHLDGPCYPTVRR